MKIDILLITYNQEQYIAQAVESILMQRVNDDVQVRVIVADDCSTDKTLEIIKSYEDKSPYPYIYLTSEKNLGISKNYQRAFAQCDGDYITILEGDDWWSTPNHIEQHIRFLETHKECSMSMNAIMLYKQEINEYKQLQWGYGNYNVYYVDTKTQISQGNQLGNLSACALRNSCIQKLPNSLYDMFIADWMLGIMLSQQGLIALLKESTSVYRINQNSEWASLSYEQQKMKMLTLADEYDSYQNGKYHVYWSQFKAIYSKSKRLKCRDFLPPVVIKLGKLLLNQFVNNSRNV